MEIQNEFITDKHLSPIQQFFLGRSVFITGATGLVGKVLVEKLLRCCPGIGNLYLMIRPKRGKTPEYRIDKLFQAKLFQKLIQNNPNYRKNVRLVYGDILQERLGISDKDFAEMKENVSVIFHTATRVQFNDPIKVAVQHNVAAMKTFLGVCRELPHIQAVCHVSTAYVNIDEIYVSETIAETKVSPHELMDAMKWMNGDCQRAVEKYLCKGLYPTYLVTKALGEQIVSEGRGDFPISIIRPSVITPIFRDPFPGWCDSLQGLSGLILAAAKGVFRTVMITKDEKLNVIPVDLVVNSMIVSAWHITMQRSRDIFIVNNVLDKEITADHGVPMLTSLVSKYSLVNFFRLPNITIYHKWLPYKIHSLIDERIPAYILDFLLNIFTGKRVLIPIYQKIDTVYNTFISVSRKGMIFCRDNSIKMEQNLSDEDREIFFLNADNLVWDKYIFDCVLSGRKYLALEDPSNLPYARKKYRIWWLVTTFLKWCFILLIIYYLFLRHAF